MSNKHLTKGSFSTFLSCEKDLLQILKKIFVENPYKNELVKLLVINQNDCLDDDKKEEYNAIVNQYSVKDLKDKGYIKFVPKISLAEHAVEQNYILVSFDNFTPSMNPKFRDCTVSFDIICRTNGWDLGNGQIRPLKIAGCLDYILNDSKMTGIGTFQFIGCTELLLNEDYSGYTLTYAAVHHADDWIPG